MTKVLPPKLKAAREADDVVWTNGLAVKLSFFRFVHEKHRRLHHLQAKQESGNTFSSLWDSEVEKKAFKKFPRHMHCQTATEEKVFFAFLEAKKEEGSVVQGRNEWRAGFL